ncbi:hypothetical protein BDA96_02G334600 [Sorghum bicolor]|uniref:Uncharacterized protein n=2 Tax=Sorghum bicolor TaxID=4558 RepID=A0A921RTY9_SORBI|nr:hypothetical protein BDA96_02G334600 [Sorghum bicolor]KXG36336.1 hypothetical protein SORBI_3002G318700 [Sorghum bicolor]
MYHFVELLQILLRCRKYSFFVQLSAACACTYFLMHFIWFIPCCRFHLLVFIISFLSMHFVVMHICLLFMYSAYLSLDLIVGSKQ